jgi:hypothetical protein
VTRRSSSWSSGTWRSCCESGRPASPAGTARCGRSWSGCCGSSSAAGCSSTASPDHPPTAASAPAQAAGAAHRTRPRRRRGRGRARPQGPRRRRPPRRRRLDRHRRRSRPVASPRPPPHDRRREDSGRLVAAPPRVEGRPAHEPLPGAAAGQARRGPRHLARARQEAFRLDPPGLLRPHRGTHRSRAEAPHRGHRRLPRPKPPLPQEARLSRRPAGRSLPLPHEAPPTRASPRRRPENSRSRAGVARRAGRG